MRPPSPAEKPSKDARTARTYSATLKAVLPDVIVWGAWLGMLGASLWLIAACGRNVPFADDWELVPVLAGEQPVTMNWLWSQHNEHRIPLPRLVELGLLAASGNDFRAGMYFNVFALAGIAAAMIVAARKLRGATAWSDVFFPVLLLNWGHCENLLWCWQVEFLLSTLLSSVVLLLIAVFGEKLTLWSIAGIACCLMLLPLTGANGFLLTPPLLLWLSYSVLRWWRSPPCPGRVSRALALMALIAASATAAAYLLQYQRVGSHPLSPNIGATLRTCMECLSTSFGYLEDAWPLGAVAAAGLVLLGAGITIGVARRQPNERCRAAGLLLFLAAVMALVLAIGYGRGGLGRGSGLMGRYYTILTPGLCCVYLILIIYGRPRLDTWAQRGILLLVCLSIFQHLAIDLQVGAHRRQVTEAFRHDVEAGIPPLVLASYYTSEPHRLYPFPEQLWSFLRAAQPIGLKPLRGMKPDPPFKVVPVSKDVAEMKPNGVFELKQARLVYAIVVSTTLNQPATGYADVTLHWVARGDPGSPSGKKSKTLSVLAQPGKMATMFWVNEVVEQFWVEIGDSSGIMSVLGALLVVPEGESKKTTRLEKESDPMRQVLAADSQSADDGKIIRSAPRETGL